VQYKEYKELEMCLIYTARAKQIDGAKFVPCV